MTPNHLTGKKKARRKPQEEPAPPSESSSALVAVPNVPASAPAPASTPAPPLDASSKENNQNNANSTDSTLVIAPPDTIIDTTNTPSSLPIVAEPMDVDVPHSVSYYHKGVKGILLIKSRYQFQKQEKVEKLKRLKKQKNNNKSKGSKSKKRGNANEKK